MVGELERKNQDMAFSKTCGKKSLLFLFTWLILSACANKNSRVVVIHLVPFNYEGVLIESLQSDGQRLQRSGDTLFIPYDERGVAIYRDTIAHFSGLKEKYFYAKDGKISSAPQSVDSQNAYHGICVNGHPFYSVVVSRNYPSSLLFKKEQKEKVEKYICDR